MRLHHNNPIARRRGRPGFAEVASEVKSLAVQTAKATEEIASTGEISENVAGAAQGTDTVVAALGDVAGAATATRSSAETVLSASRSVESAVAKLRGEVETFLGEVAA